jgi:hypothetical protein
MTGGNGITSAMSIGTPGIEGLPNLKGTNKKEQKATI